MINLDFLQLVARTSELHGHAVISNGGNITKFRKNQGEVVLEYLFLKYSCLVYSPIDFLFREVNIS